MFFFVVIVGIFRKDEFTLSGCERTITDLVLGSQVLTVLSQLPVVIILRDWFKWTQRTASSWFPTAKCFPLFRSHILIWLSNPPQNACVASYSKTMYKMFYVRKETGTEAGPRKLLKNQTLKLGITHDILVRKPST